MTPDDINAFFARRESLDADRYLELDYTFECAGDPRAAAAHLASEQSTAQWRRVGVDEDYRPRFAAKVIALDASPSPPGFSVPLEAKPSGAVHHCRATIAHPHANFGARIPNLLSAVLGEGAFFAPGIPLLRLEDIRFPSSFLSHFEGPRFGVEGVRRQLQVFGRPIFFGVIKPNIGLPPAPFAELGYQGWLGGLDVAKDDEMLADAPWSPLAERATLLGEASRRAARETGVPLLLFGYGRNVCPVDTHVHRVMNKTGIVQTSSPDRTFKEIAQYVPAERAYHLHTNMLKLGREFCRPTSPACNICPIKKLCDYGMKHNSPGEKRINTRVLLLDTI